jgi:hypothetical protein
LDENQTLQQWARACSLPARQVERARVILLSAAGKPDLEIAAEIGISSQKAARWRKRFLKVGVGWSGKGPPGRETTVDRVVQLTTLGKPYNATHWSTRMMAAESGISEASVRRIWRAHGLKPHLIRTFKIRKDPNVAETVHGAVGFAVRIGVTVNPRHV